MLLPACTEGGGRRVITHLPAQDLLRRGQVHSLAHGGEPRSQQLTHPPPIHLQGRGDCTSQSPRRRRQGGQNTTRSCSCSKLEHCGLNASGLLVHFSARKLRPSKQLDGERALGLIEPSLQTVMGAGVQVGQGKLQVTTLCRHTMWGRGTKKAAPFPSRSLFSHIPLNTLRNTNSCQGKAFVCKNVRPLGYDLSMAALHPRLESCGTRRERINIFLVKRKEEDFQDSNEINSKTKIRAFPLTGKKPQQRGIRYVHL